jgi:hypothetical protein
VTYNVCIDNDTEGEATMKTITIRQDTSDDAMVGGDGWYDYDAAASVEKFIKTITDLVANAYPDCEIVVRQTAHDSSVEITDDSDDDTDNYRELRDDESYIETIIENVYLSQDWYVKEDQPEMYSTSLSQQFVRLSIAVHCQPANQPTPG